MGDLEDAIHFVQGADERAISFYSEGRPEGAVQEGDLTESKLLIKTMGKEIKNNPIFKKQVLLPPATTRQRLVEGVLKQMAEVNCSIPAKLIGA